MERFLTLAGRVEAELVERKSRFLAIAVPVRDRAAADTFIAAEARAHRDPSHVVPALRLHDGSAYASDAGEPAGSSGPPLLALLEGRGIADVACVVVRWFGGVKLGIGGLVRAYPGALAAALDAATLVEARTLAQVRVRYDHGLTSPVLRALAAAGACELVHAYGAAGAETVAAVPRPALARLGEALRDGTRGAVGLERLGDVVVRG